MSSTNLRLSRSKAILHLTVGLGLSVISVPAAMAVTTAVATASLSFNLSSPNGTLGFSRFNLNGIAELSATAPALARSYWNTGASTSYLATDSIGSNSYNISSSISGRTFGATSGISLDVPPFLSSDGRASSFNFVNIDTVNIIPVDDMFDLKFASVRGRLDLSLGSDASDFSTFGSASWFVGLSYSLPGDTDGGSYTSSLSRSIGSDGSSSDSDHYYSSFTFSSIPASAANIQLYWETTAGARAMDGGLALSAPDGGTTFVLFGTALGAVEWMRRRLRRSSPLA